ncbi:MFS transporter, partial [Streptomyces sp. SID8455]|nr:MFS transporter [Streptomyces sp. SID8455]
RISEALSTLLGPGLAGLLVAYWQVSGSYLVIAAAYALSAAVLLPLRKLHTERDEGDAPMWRRLATGWQEFRSRQWLWGVIAV